MRSNLHSIITVGRLRSIQNAYEEGAYKNPDHLAHHFVHDATGSPPPVGNSPGPWWTNPELLRAHPFYNYLLLRTRYYDDVFVRAVNEGARQIVLLGSGTDTRPYRFRETLVRKGVRVIECDQPAAIHEKAADARRLGDCAHVEFSSIDLHSTTPEEWARDADYHAGTPTLIVAEGVTPYVLAESWSRWLQFFSESAAPGTSLVCDYKFTGCDDDCGKVGIRNTIRVSPQRSAVVEMHRALGWDVREILRATDLRSKYHAEEGCPERPMFSQDVIVLSTLGALSQPEIR